MIAVKLIIGLLLILAGAEFFTNGVEWLGKRLRLSQGAVGSLLAAVGTALPESTIPVIAFIKGGEAGNHVGVGAILGAPFMLSTLGFFVVGLGAMVYAGRRENGPAVMLSFNQLSKDLGYFLPLYALALLAAFVQYTWLRWVIALLLIAGYLHYTVKTVTGDCAQMGECAPLYLTKAVDTPRFRWIGAQVVLALILIVSGAYVFVGGVEGVAGILGLSPLLVALVVAPVATELPEKLNSVIWMRENKDILASGNMSGAMVFQSSLLPAMGIVTTPWVLTGLPLMSTIFAITAGSYLWLLNRSKKGAVHAAHLMAPAALYLIFAVMVLRSVYPNW